MAEGINMLRISSRNANQKEGQYAPQLATHFANQRGAASAGMSHKTRVKNPGKTNEFRTPEGAT